MDWEAPSGEIHVGDVVKPTVRAPVMSLLYFDRNSGELLNADCNSNTIWQPSHKSMQDGKLIGGTNFWFCAFDGTKFGKQQVSFV